MTQANLRKPKTKETDERCVRLILQAADIISCHVRSSRMESKQN